MTATVCEAYDGFSPLNDSARLALDRARKGGVWACQDGFVILDDHDDTILVAVSPEARGKGLGTSLVTEAVVARSGHSAWAFRILPIVRAVAAKPGLHSARELLRTGRPPTGIVPVSAPTGYRTLPLEPSDAEGAVEANRVAFACHPEQGRLTIDDLQVLARQPWLNAAGLLATYHDDEVAGLHRTKRHDADLGEICVLTVRLGHGGAEPGRALLTTGLAHLYIVDCENVELYVEAFEERVVALYAITGFRILVADTTYRRGDAPRPGGRTGSSRSTATRVGSWPGWASTIGCWI